jgi:MFS family permease
MVGSVSVIIPIVNMISVSLPRENVATGLGLNTMLRNIGGAVGPVVATSIMSTYTISVRTPLGVMSFPSSTAFDTIFYVGIAALVLAIVFALLAKNYTFGKKNSNQGPAQEGSAKARFIPPMESIATGLVTGIPGSEAGRQSGTADPETPGVTRVPP